MADAGLFDDTANFAAIACDQIPQLVWVLDDAGRLVFANRAFVDSSGTLVGTLAPWGRFLSADDAWAFQSAWNAASRFGTPVEFEGALRTLDGDQRWHLFRLNPAPGPNGRLWFGTATDIHARKEISREVEGLSARLDAEMAKRAADAPGRSRLSASSGERYRKKTELLHEILDRLFEAVVVYDAAGQVLLFNTMAHDLFGPGTLALPAADWPARIGFVNLDGSTVVPVEELPATRALRGEPSVESEFFVDGPTGRRRCVGRGTTLWDGLGGVRGGVTVYRDVTDKRRMEEQLAHLQKLEAIGHLAVGIAHEINTPVQFVGDNLRFLAGAFRDLTADGPAPDLSFILTEMPAAIGQSLEGIDRVAAIVRAVREFAAPGPDDPTSVSVNRAVENAVAVTRSVWSAAAELTTDFDQELPVVPGYARDLSQAIYHLLMNAVEAVESGRPSATGRPGRILVRTRLVGESVVVSVSDNGCGIPASIKPKVFDPFFTTKPPGRHTGQGLTRVLGSVVKRHRGTVEIASEPNVGTTVTARLPVRWPDEPRPTQVRVK